MASSISRAKYLLLHPGTRPSRFPQDFNPQNTVSRPSTYTGHILNQPGDENVSKAGPQVVNGCSIVAQ
eukprot:5386129-Amphidinium_carterae.1